MSDELKGLFDTPIEQLKPVYRDTREDIDLGSGGEDASGAGLSLEEAVPAADVQVETTQQVVAEEQPAGEQVIKLFTGEQPAVTDTPAAPSQEAPALPKDWKEVLKENGFDDYALGVLEYYKSTGDLTPYLEVKSVDYSKMSDAEILRKDLRSKYSELSDEDFDLLYQRKVVDQYKLDETMYSDDDRRIGAIELKIAAKEIREKLIEQQQAFKAPERQQPSTDVNQQQIAEQVAQWKQAVDTNPVTQSLLNTKRISVGDGDQVVNFELESVDKILQSTYDPNSFISSFVKPDGSVDLQKWYKVLAYSENMQAWERSVMNYGKTVGRQEVFNEIKNPPKPEVGNVPGGPTGSFKDDLLNAFLHEGVKRG